MVDNPYLGYFLEVKSRTWSRKDADYKAEIASDLIRYLGVEPLGMVAQDYLALVETG